jgi:16S rRNA processing protein RimM
LTADAGPGPAHLVIGRIGRAHGVGGEVRVEVLTDFPDRFAPGARVYVGPEDATAPIETTIVSSRPHQGRLLLRLALAADRDAAAALTGSYLFVPATEARALPPGDYYEHQLVGLEVVTAEGERVGRVRSLLETGTADVLVVATDGRDVLLPLIAEVVAAIDLEAGRMTITPLPGLLD